MASIQFQCVRAHRELEPDPAYVRLRLADRVATGVVLQGLGGGLGEVGVVLGDLVAAVD